MKKQYSDNWLIMVIVALLMQPVTAYAFIAAESGPTPTSDSTSIPSISASGDTEARVTIKKKSIESWSPTQAQMKDEDYSKLGPGGGPTPACPVDDSKCPDINGRVNGVKVDAATIANDCPAACVRTRSGTVTSGDIPASCPSGYVQVASYNAAPEWVRPSSIDDPIRINSLEQFMSYWNDPGQFNCKGDAVSYGFEVCLPLNDQLYAAAPFPSVYRAVPVTGMAYQGNQPFSGLNPWDNYNGIDPWKLLFGATEVEDAGLSSIFNNIVKGGKVPSVWAPYPYPDGKGATSPEFESEYREQYRMADMSEEAGCTERDGDENIVKAQSQLTTYSDAICMTRAMVNYTCKLDNNSCTAPDMSLQYEDWKAGSRGSCTQLYVKVKIPVWAIACYPRPGAVTLVPNPDGSAIHTSLICSRVQPTWK